MAYKKPVGYGAADGSFGNRDSSAAGQDAFHVSPGPEFEECTAVVQFKTHSDGYRKRMKEFVNNGFWDFGEHLLHAVYNLENGRVECALNHLGGALYTGEQ